MWRMCKKSRLRWYEHVKRRDHGYVGRYTLEMDPPWKRKKGQLNPRWLDCVSSDLNLLELQRMMPRIKRDRRSWCLPQWPRQVGAVRRRTLSILNLLGKEYIEGTLMSKSRNIPLFAYNARIRFEAYSWNNYWRSCLILWVHISANNNNMSAFIQALWIADP